MRPDRPGVQQLHLHARRPDQYQPVEQVQHQRITTCRARIGSDSCSTGARCSSSRRKTARAGAARAAQQLPRRGFEHARTGHVGSCHLADAGQSRELRSQRLVPGAGLLQQRRGWGTKIGLKNVPGPDKLFPESTSADYLNWGRAEFGGSGNYLWALTDDLVKGITPGSSGSSSSRITTTVRLAHGGGLLQLQPRGDRRLPAERHARYDRASGNAFASFLLGEVQNSDITTNRLRLGPMAILLRVRAGRLARQRQADAQLRPALRVPRRPSRATIPTATRTSTRTCRSRRRPARRLGVRRRRSGPHRQADDVRRVALGFSPGSARSIP